MITCARITKFVRKSAISPGWMTPHNFREWSSNQISLPAQFTDPEILSEYQGAWGAIAAIVDSNQHLVQEFFSVQSDQVLFTVHTFENKENLDQLLALVEGTSEQARLISARLKMAKLLDVSITLFQPVDLEINPQVAITPDFLIRVTDKLKGLVLVS